MSQKLQDRSAAPPIDDAAKKLLSRKTAESGPQGERLDLTPEVLTLAGHISDAARFASIARTVRDDVLAQKISGSDANMHTEYGLLKSQVDDLIFIIDQAAYAAEAADAAMLAFDEVCTRHCVLRTTQGGAA